MQIGYVRVSTNDQNTDLQRQALERAGCEQIFEEKMSGTVANRPGHCCKVSDEAAFCLIQRPYISKTLL
ncbi:recombinase family protein, partial [Enterobacter kobei]|uniref:recombinase family protein n=1 Tax=Enterobacter kobei TaxID=208224 RepID=UPI0039C953CB